MTSLYATPRKARVISDGRIVNIHGYSQEQFIEGGGAEVVAIVEYESGRMGTQLVSLLELCAPTAPQLGRTLEPLPVDGKDDAKNPNTGTCPKCGDLRDLSEVDADGNPICYECWDSSLPF